MPEHRGPFPLPSEITDVPGAERWASMYAPFARFQPEDDAKFWFYNATHYPEPVPAFDGLSAEVAYSAIGANTARIFVFPATLGIEYRIVNGRVYLAANPVTDPEEIGRRLEIFQRRARPDAQLHPAKYRQPGEQAQDGFGERNPEERLRSADCQ